MSENTLIFTKSAASKVYELIEDEGNFALNLRVFITGGGCSGFQYGFTFDETINDDDMIIEQSVVPDTSSENKKENESGDGGKTIQIKLLIDPMSFQYLRGATVDYREDVNGAQFIIKNPNAKTTCGCGSSFSV
jgi:iron-sulfur cluster insertion protein